MVTKKILIILAVVLFAGSNLYAVPQNKIFTSSGQILPGEQWNIVSIYDTPPDYTTVDMFGGTVDWIRAYDASTVNITGGMVNGVQSYGFSVANISWQIGYSANAYEHGTVNILNNGDVFSSVAFGFGAINMKGGIVHDFFYSWDSSVINFYSGVALGVLGAEDISTINLYGGVVDHLSAGDNSIINIFGHDLNKTDSGGRYGYGQVYGFFTDNSAFTIDLYNAQTYSHINLIPEPATLLLLGMGGFILRRKE